MTSPVDQIAAAAENRGGFANAIHATLLFAERPWPVETPLAYPGLAALAAAGRLEVLSAMATAVTFSFDGIEISTFWINAPRPIGAQELLVSPLFRDQEALADHRTHMLVWTDAGHDLASRRNAALKLAAFAAHLKPSAMLWAEAGVLTGPSRLRRIEAESAAGRLPVDCWIGLRLLPGDTPEAGPLLASSGLAHFLGQEAILRPRPGRDSAMVLSVFYTGMAFLLDLAPELALPVTVTHPDVGNVRIERRTLTSGEERLELTETA